MTGSFLLEQLQGMDNAAGGKATFAYGGTPFAASLRSEVSAGRAAFPAAVQQHVACTDSPAVLMHHRVRITWCYQACYRQPLQPAVHSSCTVSLCACYHSAALW